MKKMLDLESGEGEARRPKISSKGSWVGSSAVGEGEGDVVGSPAVMKKNATSTGVGSTTAYRHCNGGIELVSSARISSMEFR